MLRQTVLLLCLLLFATGCPTTGDDDDCPAADPLDGTPITVNLSLETADAPAFDPPACLTLTLFGFDSQIVDQAANQLGTFVSPLSGLPATAQVSLPADAHEQIEPGGDDPSMNHFYVVGWIDVDGDGVEASGDYTSAAEADWFTDPPPAEIDDVLGEVQ